MHTPRPLYVFAIGLILAGSLAAGERAPHARLELLAQDSIEIGRVSYEQIARAVYGDALEEITAMKRAWRLAHPDLPWASDYDLLAKVAVNVVPGQERESRAAAEGVLARYTLETNTATIPRTNAGAMLAHEVAHGLTRRSIRTAEAVTRIDSRLALDLAPPTGSFAREGGFHFEWLSYISSQSEFEVRLQALNRYAFEMTGRAIETPADALRALASLGAKLETGELVPLLKPVEGKEAMSVARSIASTAQRPGLSVPPCFRNADDLRRALQMAAAWNPDVRSVLLEKIALEAPGHF